MGYIVSLLALFILIGLDLEIFPFGSLLCQLSLFLYFCYYTNYHVFFASKVVYLKELNLIEITQVSGGAHDFAGLFWEAVHVVAGAAIGASIAAAHLTVPVALFGIIPIPLTISGAFIGGSIGHILFNLEDITSAARDQCTGKPFPL